MKRPYDVEALYRLLIETVRDYAIFALDAEGYIRTWNPGAERFKGYTAEEAIGRHFSMFYPAEDLAVDKPGRELVLAARDGRFEDEGWRLRKNGTRFWANVVITALRAPDGELVGFAKVTRDLTERVLAERRAIEDARHLARAEAANEAKSEFLRTLSHELRTPLNAIGGYTDLLLLGVHGPLTEVQREDLERVQRSQQHLLRLIDQLLDFSRIEAGTIEYELSTIPLHEALAEAVELLQPQATVAGVTFDLQPDRAGVAALADTARVRQIVLNLLSNTIRYASPGRVVISIESGDMAGVRITDSGPGIPPDARETIFEPFVQLGRSLTTAHEGAGLGLPISRRLARAMGGDLVLSGAPGQGATFVLTLPRADVVRLRQRNG